MRSLSEISLPERPGMTLCCADADKRQKTQNSHLDWSNHPEEVGSLVGCYFLYAERSDSVISKMPNSEKASRSASEMHGWHDV